jgi:hypothetical protein
MFQLLKFPRPSKVVVVLLLPHLKIFDILMHHPSMDQLEDILPSSLL